jgi:pimeloyl-ACP methyl ester carboxylesterase
MMQATDAKSDCPEGYRIQAVRVTGFDKVYVEEKGAKFSHATYKLEVTATYKLPSGGVEEETWRLNRRFNYIRFVRNVFAKNLKGANVSMPAFPSRHFFLTAHDSEDFLTRRTEQLDAFFVALLERGRGNDVLQRCMRKWIHPVLHPSWSRDLLDSGMSRVANNGDVHLQYKIFGEEHTERPWYVLVMGLGCSMTMWTDAFVESLLERGFRVCVMDNRDTGDVSWKGKSKPSMVWNLLKDRMGLGNFDSAEYDLTDMARDVQCVMDAAEIERAHVCGLSMGGMISQILAATAPQRLLSLTLIMTGPGHYKHLPGADREEYMVFLLKSDKAIEIELRRKGVYREAMPRHHHAVLKSGYLHRYTREICVPTLVIHGADDRLLKPAHGQHVANLIAGPSTFLLVQDMAHNLPLPQLGFIMDTIAHHARTCTPLPLGDGAEPQVPPQPQHVVAAVDYDPVVEASVAQPVSQEIAVEADPAPPVVVAAAAPVEVDVVVVESPEPEFMVVQKEEEEKQ